MLLMTCDKWSRSESLFLELPHSPTCNPTLILPKKPEALTNILTSPHATPPLLIATAAYHYHSHRAHHVRLLKVRGNCETSHTRHTPAIMNRMPDPQPPPQPQPQQPQSQEGQQQSQSQSKSWQMPTGFASTGSQAHTQSFEEIYGVPENFLEIEVRPTKPTSYNKEA